MSVYGIDMGHTLSGTGTGAVGVVKETDKNREVGKRLIAMLQEKGHTVINCTVDKSNNDLADRVAKANAQKLDLFVSIHLNAFNGSADGVETHIYNNYYQGKEVNRIKAKEINDAIAASVGFRNRGVKESNFYVLRETVAPAVLVEVGFCDSAVDMNKWNTEKIAAAMFKGITGTVYVAQQSNPIQGTGETFFRVVAGSFKDRGNAETMQSKLKKDGYSSFLDEFKKDGATYLRVIAGSYKDRANADKVLNELKSKGYSVFIAVYKK